jgi:ABC-2 type transport system permease protein
MSRGARVERAQCQPVRGRHCGLHAPRFRGERPARTTAPEWIQTISAFIPLTHGIEAARRLARGETLSDVAGLLAAEAQVGAVFLVVGLSMLRLFEFEGRRSATLEAF